VIPITLEAIANISKSFRKFLSNVAGKHEVKEHILSKMPMEKYKIFSMEK
jgi:fructose-1,6-bisphosphatase